MNPTARVLENVKKLEMTRKFLPSFIQSADEPFMRHHLECARAFTDPSLLARSALLWVSSDMTKLIKHASVSLPSFKFDIGLPLWPHAIVFFSSPLFKMTETQQADGCQWTQTDDRSLFGGAFNYPDQRFAYYAMKFSADHGEPILSDTYVPNDSLRCLAALWLLLRQKVAVRSTIEADRATRRRYEKEGLGEPPSVTLVELRKPLTSDRKDAQAASVDWSHRWLVDGHWRNQYHPSTDSHEPTWIAPYVKGPDDKPFQPKTRIHAWVR